MLYSALVFGMLSSLHCIGMCGPIAMMLPVDQQHTSKKFVQLCVYHLGRLTAYAFIGLLFGILGKGLFMAGLQQKLSIFIGVIMIVLASIPQKIVASYAQFKPLYSIISKLKNQLGKQFKNRRLHSFYLIGVFNGFLPCGMVYVALFGALAMQSASLGVGYMILFGIGTVPLMTLVVVLKGLLNLPQRATLQKLLPVVTCIIGVLFILRGLGLGIPYVSPGTMNLFIQQSPHCK